jgi:ABC-type Fe3+-hydroxamate transport system substrate-binding protein
VSLVPSQTELLVDLGLKDRIVGITKFCVHPVGLLKEKQIVGGTKQIHLDKIKALQPDIVLCNKEENTKDIVESLAEFVPVHVSDVHDLDDAANLILDYGELFDCSANAKQLYQQLQQERNKFQEETKDWPVLKVAYFIWRNPWIVAANQTFINHLLTINKLENVFANINRYPEVKLEDLKAKNAELALLSSEPFPFKAIHVKEFHESCTDISAVLVDGEYFSWYGSRLLKAFAYFKQWRKEIRG